MADPTWDFATVSKNPDGKWWVWFGNTTANLTDANKETGVLTDDKEAALRSAFTQANAVTEAIWIMDGELGFEHWQWYPVERVEQAPSPVKEQPPRVFDRTLRSNVRPGRG